MQANRDFEVLRALEALQQNPDMFSQEQADQLLAYAQQNRIPLQFPTAAPSSSVMGSSIMDSLLYGLMPNENMPTMVTEDQRSADSTGSFLGKAGSMIITALLAKAGLQGLSKGTGKLAGIANKIVDSPALLGGVAGGLGGLMTDITDEGPSFGMGMFGGVLGSVGNSLLAKKIAPKVSEIAKVTDDAAKAEVKATATAPKRTTGNVPNTTTPAVSNRSERDVRVLAESKVLAKERPDYVIEKDGKYYANTEKLLADKYSLANGSIHGRAYPSAEKAFYAIRSSNLAHTDAVAKLDPKVRQFLVDNKDVVFHDKNGKWFINTDYLDEAGLVYNPTLKGKAYDSPLVATNSAYKTVTTKAENVGKYGARTTTPKTNTTATPPPVTEPVTTAKAADVVDTPPATTATVEPPKPIGLKRKPTEEEIAAMNKKNAENADVDPGDLTPSVDDLVDNKAIDSGVTATAPKATAISSSTDDLVQKAKDTILDSAGLIKDDLKPDVLVKELEKISINKVNIGVDEAIRIKLMENNEALAQQLSEKSGVPVEQLMETMDSLYTSAHNKIDFDKIDNMSQYYKLIEKIYGESIASLKANPSIKFR